jgi:hypothetical protein
MKEETTNTALSTEKATIIDANFKRRCDLKQVALAEVSNG